VAGGLAAIELECVAAVRLLTVPNGRRKSDAAQRLRDSGDAFRQYKAIQKQVTLFWGTSDKRGE
jgi:hypothetical protein